MSEESIDFDLDPDSYTYDTSALEAYTQSVAQRNVHQWQEHSQESNSLGDPNNSVHQALFDDNSFTSVSSKGIGAAAAMTMDVEEADAKEAAEKKAELIQKKQSSSKQAKKEEKKEKLEKSSGKKVKDMSKSEKREEKAKMK